MEPIKAIKTKRIDIVFNVYNNKSLKSEERERRGHDESRYIVRENTIIPKQFSNTIMTNGKRKIELFLMIAKTVAMTKTNEVTLVATQKSDVVSNKEIQLKDIRPCNQDDADTRHSKDM